MIDFLTDYFSSFQPHSQAEFTIFLVISMIFSALSIFLGYKLTRLWSTLIGAGIGFIAGFIIGETIWETSGAGFIAGIVLAVILGAISFFIYKAGVFIMCASMAFTFVYPGLSVLINIQALSLVLSIVIAIIAGVVAIIFLRPFIIVTTAIGGSFEFAQSLFSLFPAATQSSLLFGLSWPILLVGSILSVLGIIVQFVTTKKHGKRA